MFQLLAENEIDGEAFLLLSHEEVKDLVKVVGPRTKLMKKKCQLLQQGVPVRESPAPQVLCIVYMDHSDGEHPKIDCK